MQEIHIPSPANDAWPWQYVDVLHADGWIYVLAAPRLWSALRRIPPKEHVLRLVDAFTQYAHSDHCYHSLPKGTPRPDPSRRGPAAKHLHDLLLQWEPPEVTREIQEAARAVLVEERVGLPDVPWDEREPYEDEVPVEAGLLWPEGFWNEEAFLAAGGPPKAPGKSRPPRPGPRVLRPEPMTAEEWAARAEPGELFDGVLVEEEAATPIHDAVSAWFLNTLHAWATPRKAQVFGPRHKVVLADRSGAVPDACVYLGKDARKGSDSVSFTKPTLVIEVLSPSQVDVARDRLTKLGAYRTLGVLHVWIVDPVEHICEGFDLGADGLYRTGWLYDRGKFSPPGFDGLVLDLDALWAEVAPLAPSPAR